MKYTPASFVLTFFGLVTGGFACGGSSSSTSFLSAIGDVESAALKCDPGAAGGALALDSIAASACNQAQASYVGLQYAMLIAYAGRCFCIENYYDTAKTIGDVGLWVECVSPWNTLAVTHGRAIAEFENTHSDVFATCNVCTAGSPFPPMDPRLEQVLAVLEFIMDWRGKLQEAEIELLKEGVEAAVISAALGNNGVPNGVSSPTVDWIVSTITQGQASSSLGGPSLRARQTTDNGTATNTTSPMISQLIGVQVKLRMVPVNVTAAVLEDQMKTLFAGADFASNLTTWNANLTSAAYSTVYGNGSTVASSPTGSSPSGSAATPSPTKGVASSLGPSMLLGVSVGCVVALFSLL